MQKPFHHGGTSRETIGLFSILGVVLITNISTAELSPTVWMDEVMFTDPAVNLRLFGRFTSSAWPAQSDQDFWSSYPPLHSLLLSAWLWLAPITPTGVRSLNFILIGLSCLALWSAHTRNRKLLHVEITLSAGRTLIGPCHFRRVGTA